jgi:sugar lactone lactonase YvrE
MQSMRATRQWQWMGLAAWCVASALGAGGFTACGDSKDKNSGADGSTNGDASVPGDGAIACENNDACPENQRCGESGYCEPFECPGSNTPGCQCAEGCNGSVIGSGGSGFDPNDSNSSGVQLDDNGYLVLKSEQLPNLQYIWVAQTGPGQIAKVSTNASDLDPATGQFREVARYATGPEPNPSGYWGRPNGSLVNTNDPSRTSVNVVGDAFVGNRQGRTVTKIAGAVERCVDRNNNSQIDTSNSSTPIAGAWNGLVSPDECVLWTTPLPDGASPIRAVASQDIALPDGGWQHAVWVGTWTDSGTSRIYKLDGDTGTILVDITAPTRAYGFALDKNETLWVASFADASTFASDTTNSRISRIDTRKCTESAACEIAALDPCAETRSFNTCVTQVIDAPEINGGPNRSTTYGITVDKNQRVWFGDDQADAGGSGGGIVQYDPSKPVGQRWTRIAVPNATHGIAADSLGFVYAASNAGIYVVDGDNFTSASVARMIPGTEDGRYRGIAVDAEGRIWGISVGPHAPGFGLQTDDGIANEFATVIVPQSGSPRIDLSADAPNVAAYFPIHPVTNVPSNQSVSGFDYPYTYSDMTGLQYRLATGKLGSFTHTFAGCSQSTGLAPIWQNFLWDAVTPVGTYLKWSARAWNNSDTRPPTFDIVLGYVYEGARPPEVPSDAITSPLALADALGAGSVNKQNLEIRVDLVVWDQNANNITPTVRSFEATHTCFALTQ